MKATILDMRRNPKKILEALARGESVTLTSRGVEVGRVEPARNGKRPRAADHEAFGLWAGRADMKDPSAWVREQRRGRFDAL